MEPDVLIADEQYLALQKTFLATGKGRRPDLPPLTITNRLLIQLDQLRLQSGQPWTKLQEWFLKISPSTKTARIRSLVEKATKQLQQLPADQKAAFLELKIDLDFITPALDEIGINRATILEPPSNGSEDVRPVSNRVVVDLEHHFNQDRSLNKEGMLQWLLFFNQSSSRTEVLSAVRKTLSVYKKRLNCKSKNPQAFEAFLKEQFRCSNYNDSQSQASTSNINDTEIKNDKPTPSKKVNFEELFNTAKQEIVSLKAVLTDLNNTKAVIENDLKRAQENVAILQKRLEVCEKDCRQAKADRSKVKNSKRVLVENHGKSVANLKKGVKEKDSVITELGKKSSTLRRIIDKLKKDNKSLRSQLNTVKNDLEMKRFFHDIQLKTDENNTYSDDMRLVIMSLQSDAGVSASNVKKVIKIVAEGIFHYPIPEENLPCAQTALNIVSEAKVVSDIQIAEKIEQSENITLHLDGTSRDHKKVLGHQITVDDGDTLYLGFTSVATEDTSTILDVTVALLKKLTDSYSDYSEEHSDRIFLNLIDKITSLMSDRASVMKSFGKKFEEFINSETGKQTRRHFLHCNAHYLLGLSSACDKAMRRIESEIKADNGESLGRDKERQFFRFEKVAETATNRVIRTTCDVLGPRGDQRHGYRLEWETFCEG